ncbi:MAG: tagaturonate reductase [Chitinophagaceae bacterium]|nr:MAG: tagaturonate reductase [Chitinophagaceae bacterium]
MILSKSTIKNITAADLKLPSPGELDLPEKVLQFGTGVLLRGLPDHLIALANSRSEFNGRIVVVKSTANGRTDAFEEQDALYTLCVRGVEDGKKIAYNQVIPAISRVLSAASHWDAILECAANPEMEIIISNTTEVGISMVKDNMHASPPESFPGKLLAFLYHRYKIFNGAADKGMVVIPTELIPGNADKLLAIVLEQAHTHGLEAAFIDWLETANHFCNSLVDRIVPGAFNREQRLAIEASLGYEDELMIMSESYALWAIQTDSDLVKSKLSFANSNPEVVLTDDIEKFGELKIRLLNGSHSFACGLAVLAGFATVKDAMENGSFNNYISSLMLDEIVPAIESSSISSSTAAAFAAKVLDRYRNPFIEHKWISICMNYSSKMALRNIPLLFSYLDKKAAVPSLMSLGMAAHIAFMRNLEYRDGKFYGKTGEVEYEVNDSNAGWYQQAWVENGADKIVQAVLRNEELWQADLTRIAGLEREVNYWLSELQNKGSQACLAAVTSKTTAD